MISSADVKVRITVHVCIIDYRSVEVNKEGFCEIRTTECFSQSVGFSKHTWLGALMKPLEMKFCKSKQKSFLYQCYVFRPFN